MRARRPAPRAPPPRAACCAQTIEARLAHQRALLSLQGRLDLLLAQLPKRSTATSPGGAGQQPDNGPRDLDGPAVEYQETDSEVEVEDPFAGACVCGPAHPSTRVASRPGATIACAASAGGGYDDDEDDDTSAWEDADDQDVASDDDDGSGHMDEDSEAEDDE